jgi:hypothetical protein
MTQTTSPERWKIEWRKHYAPYNQSLEAIVRRSRAKPQNKGNRNSHSYGSKEY